MSAMNVSGITLDDVSNQYSGIATNSPSKTEGSSAFESVFQSALNVVNETDQLTNQAEVEEIKYAMGQSDNLHDLQVAQQKAAVSLQYTVAVKNTEIEAYNSIMNMQF